MMRRSAASVSAWLALALLLSACSGSQAVVDAAKSLAIQSLVDSIPSEGGVPGVVLGIEAGGAVSLFAAGKADLATGEAMTTAHQARLASVTKPMTAMLIMKLVEDGTIALTDTVEKYLPGRVAGGADITISMLLNHTGGVYDHENSDEWNERNAADPTAEWTEDEVLAISNAHGLDFQPGTQYRYSNTGYYILGMIAEAVTGRTVEEEISSRIFAPLGMTRTALSRQGMMAAPYAHGYAQLADAASLTDNSDWNLSWDWTAGSGVATASDMLLLMRALMAGLIVKPSTLALMTTPVAPATEYGYGLDVKEEEAFGEEIIGHAGANTGTCAYWVYFPARKWTIFVSFNRLDEPDASGAMPFNAMAILRQLVTQVVAILKG